ncbi:MAG: DUF4203 domain-containing protein [Nitriliruptor sp.]|nr:MAG: DUF4203 domain-containing protein [Nitriliruptor sp.]
MEELIIGLLAVAVGLLLCFAGYAALRLVIAVWGAFAGFLLGAGLVATFTGEGFLGTLLGWGVGAALALAFGLIAYLYYAVSVVIGMAAIGFSLGSTLMVGLGVPWTWLIVLVGVAVGVLLALLAIVGDLPMLLLAILGAFAGASVTIGGVLLLLGILDRGDLATPETSAALELSWWWTAAYLVLAVAGLVVQLRSVDARRGTLRDSWSGTATA